MTFLVGPTPTQLSIPVTYPDEQQFSVIEMRYNLSVMIIWFKITCRVAFATLMSCSLTGNKSPITSQWGIMQLSCVVLYKKAPWT